MLRAPYSSSKSTTSSLMLSLHRYCACWAFLFVDTVFTLVINQRTGRMLAYLCSIRVQVNVPKHTWRMSLVSGFYPGMVRKNRMGNHALTLMWFAVFFSAIRSCKISHSVPLKSENKNSFDSLIPRAFLCGVPLRFRCLLPLHNPKSWTLAWLTSQVEMRN